MTHTLGRMWMVLVALGTIVCAGLFAPPAKAQPQHHTGAIAGTVADSHGLPVSGARVTLEDQHHHVIARTASDAHGEFDFPHVRPGHYTVRAGKPHVGHGSASVDVQAGHTSTVHVTLH